MSIWRSPTTRPRTASATTSPPGSCAGRSSSCTRPTSASTGIELLAGSEVNILPDGSLDYEDELLRELDWVIASVHTAFGIAEQAMTERMIAAIEHPLVDAIGHPTGRLIERREPYAIDLRRCSPRRRGRERCSRSTPTPTAATSPRSTPARPSRAGRAHRDRLRRPPHEHAGKHALGRGHRAAGLAEQARTWSTRGRGAPLQKLRKQARQ